MTLIKFKQAVAECNDEGEIDVLCWQWLEEAAGSNGREGELALELMAIVKERLMP